jgi:hypothetical protein
MRDQFGRFMQGNRFAALGGKARARALSPKRRREIAAAARAAMVRKHFAGDDAAQRCYFAELGCYNGDPYRGDPVPQRFFHPGPIQEWLARHQQLPLFGTE